MNYVIADKALAHERGFSPELHRTNGNLIILNEKEIATSASLQGSTIEERIKEISGTVYSHTEINYIINEGGW